jgi:hypothetical protein
MAQNKKGISMPFNWLFAIIVGGFVLFLAIFVTVKIIGAGNYQTYTETAAKLTSLLDPMGTGLASGKSASINFKKETRIYLECASIGNFGRNRIAFSEKTLRNKFGEKGGNIETKKYVFGEDITEGKTLSLFSKPFYMPFKIDDVIAVFSEDYCFYQAPDEIKEELLGMEIKNLHFSEELKNCSGIKVCFSQKSGCDIAVYGMCQGYNCNSQYDFGKVVKDGRELYYTDSLLFGAIVSSPDIYECNVKRLMNRFEELSRVYVDKIKIVELKGCSSTLGNDLTSLATLSNALNDSQDLFLISEMAKTFDAKNMASICRLY